MNNSTQAAPTPGGRVLAILLLAYIFNFIDRQIIGILAVPIKAELGLSDTQLGLMGGVAFAIFYTGLGVPIALLADRKSRVTIIAVSLGIWSAFTALCGFTQNFWQLFLARMGVGVGEAGGVAPCYSLISDFFPPERRGRALAIFSLGIPIGSSIGIFFGGWIASEIDWRSAFIIVGLPGLLLAPLVKFGIREPVRGGYDRPTGTAGEEAAPFMTVLRTLGRKPSFWLLALGSASGSMLGYGLMFWLPFFFKRSLGLDLMQISVFYSTIFLVGGAVGLWLGGWLADRLGGWSVRAYALVPAVCSLLAAPAYAAALFAPSLAVGWIMFVVPQILALAWYSPVIAAIQQIAPPHMRTTTSAIFLFINNLIGIGGGTLFFGFMSDRMTAAYGADALKYSILYGLGFYILSALLYAFAVSPLQRDWHRPAAGSI